jgi:DNA-binding MarR family transcriptional regulator
MRTEEGVRLGPLSGSLGLLLRIAQLQAFRDFYAALDSFGLRPGELTVLMLLAENPGIRQGLLARALMIKRAHMTKMVQGFEEAGLLRRTVPDSDRRSVELWLTEAGAARVRALQGPLEAYERRSLPGLPAPEAAALRGLLQKYLRLAPDAHRPGKEDPCP